MNVAIWRQAVRLPADVVWLGRWLFYGPARVAEQAVVNGIAPDGGTGASKWGAGRYPTRR